MKPQKQMHYMLSQAFVYKKGITPEFGSSSFSYKVRALLSFHIFITAL